MNSIRSKVSIQGAHIRQLKNHFNFKGVQILFICLTLFAGPAFSQDIPDGWESYTDRPDILKVEATQSADSKSWQNMKDAHFSFIAELLTLYSANTEIYFLARDSEYLYDVARLVTQGTADEGRIHLLNVSRANMRDPHRKEYLAENGISEKSIKEGKKILFVDTGFSGTIPRVIGENFSPEARSELKTHLLVSSNSTHPSSRVFLSHLNPSINSVDPSGMHGTIVTYEHMARYTDRSSRFHFVEGRYVPLSLVGKATDGSVSKPASLSHMQDIRAEWNDSSRRSRFNLELRMFQDIKKLLLESESAAIKSLKRQLEDSLESSERLSLEAFIRDALSAQANANIRIEVSLSELGLKAVSGGRALSSKKNELIAKYPKWAPILEDPVTKIPELFSKQDWQMIGNLIDANVDSEINLIIEKNLFDAPAVGVKKHLQISLIENGDAGVLRSLAEHIFSQPHTSEMTDLIRLVIEKGDADVLWMLGKYTFSQPHTSQMTDLIRLVIEKGDANVLWMLAQYTFSQPHTSEMISLREALSISNPTKRRLWLLEKLGPVPFDKEGIEVSANLNVSDIIFIRNRQMKVTKKAEVGRRGVVFQVQALDNSAFYALKVAIDNSPETLASLVEESNKAREWQKLGIPHAKVLVLEKSFVLKVWIEGENGDDVIEKYSAGDVIYKSAATSLLNLVRKIRDLGAYVGDFRPENLIWNKKSWVMIDSGSVQSGLSSHDAQAKWQATDERGPKFERRWKMPLPSSSGGLQCQSLFVF